MHAYRTHDCSQLRSSDVGARVRLSGWVHRKRDHGGVLFVDLRDNYGTDADRRQAGSEALTILDGCARNRWSPSPAKLSRAKAAR
jgi:aspartyl-tRNA synthetase